MSELLEVKLSTVYDWVSHGRIPFVKLGRLIRFKKAEVFRWVEGRTIRPKEPPSRGKSKSSQANVQKEFPI